MQKKKGVLEMKQKKLKKRKSINSKVKLGKGFEKKVAFKDENKRKDFSLIFQVLIIVLFLIFLAFLFSGQTKPVEINYNYTHGKMLGDVNAPVTIVEWSDFQCGFCRKFTQETLPKIYSEFVETGKVRIIFKHYPAHQNSGILAKGSECAAEQNSFWKFHELLYKINDYSKSGLINLAKETGLDVDKFSICLDSRKYEQIIKDEMGEGVSQGIKGTPSFLINGELVSGAYPFEEFKKIIDKKLLEAGNKN